MADFSSRLRELRTLRKLRQKDLAAELGVAQTTVANYEQGSRFPGEKILQRIADFFEVSLDYLLGRTDSRQLLGTPPALAPAVEPPEPQQALSPLARRYLDTLLAGQREDGHRLVLQALADGASLRSVYREVFERSLHEVGALWEAGRIDVAQEHLFSHATQQIMSELFPRLLETRRRARGLSCLCLAVTGEQHEIGSRMVADFLEFEGWRSFFLGGNLGYQDILQAVLDRRPDLLALSATMPHNVDSAARIVRLVRERPELRSMRILVGGQAFARDPRLWRSTAADGWAPDADAAVLEAGLIAERDHPAAEPRAAR
jgi:methanogenic corrinoid protein MtbC1